MTAALPIAATRGSLPPLAGRLLWLYRIAWIGLAAVALAVLGFAVFDPGTEGVILALRLVKAAVVMTVAVILARRRQRDPVAAMLALAFLAWTITSSFDFTASDPAPLLLDRLRFLLFALALLLFPDGSWRPGWTRGVAAASACTFVLGVAEALKLLPTVLFLPMAIACVTAAVGSLVARFRLAEQEASKQQLRWVALGFVAGVGLILCARAGDALSTLGGTHNHLAILWEAMFQLGIVVIALGFLISLLRYRLFDAETAISRSAAYAMSTVALVATFAGTEALIEHAGQMYLGMGVGDVSAAAAAAVAAVLLNPLHERISGWAEQRFQRDLMMLKRDLPELLDHLSLTSTPDRLTTAVLARINQATHATWSAVLVDGTLLAGVGDGIGVAGEPITFDLACAACPPSATLQLGPRPDGSRHASDELAAVTSVLPAFRHALDASIALDSLRSDVRRARWDIQALKPCRSRKAMQRAC